MEPALVIAWSLAEPARAGEVAFAGEPRILGRGDARPGDPAPRLMFVRQRPGQNLPTPPLAGARLSRTQLHISPQDGALLVERLGRCRTLLNDAPVESAALHPGDTLLLEGELLLLCVARPKMLPAGQPYEGDARGFGEPDTHGIVGESPAAWALRERIAFVGPREPHVLVLGESGVGKELAARALHALSPRGKWPLITRSAATLPPERVDIELFGNARNYPNPGLAERPGLLGAAHRSTLFLDDIGEMPPPFQDHLLRVLDAGGEYQRLGDAAVRTADVRIIAATSRPLFELRRDLRARLALTVEIPGFAERREDIPLLSRHLLRRMAVREDEALGERFFEGWDGTTGEPRVTPALVSMLLRHRFTHHARELQGLLWRAVVGSSDKRYVDRTKAMEEEMCVEPGPVRAER